jgi:hypothetical protein
MDAEFDRLDSSGMSLGCTASVTDAPMLASNGT